MENKKSARLWAGAAWLVTLLWVFPLLFVIVMALRDSPNNLNLFSGWTLQNIVDVWQAAPFAIYYRNTIFLVIILTGSQLILGVLAAYAFSRFDFPGKSILFFVVLAQLVVYPEVMLSENYLVVAKLGLINTLPGIAIPYLSSAFGIFLMRQSFKTVPIELVEAAEMEGFGRFRVLWKVYIPLCRPTLVAFTLISISAHWTSFLWPLVITRTQAARPLTVGIVRFMAPESGIDFAALTAGTFIVVVPLLILFIALQKQFVQSFMRSGIK